MSETSLGAIPENLSITDVYTTATVSPLPAMLVGRRALYDELIWDEEGGFATAWESKSSLVHEGGTNYHFKLQRQAFSAAGLALFVIGTASSGGSPSGAAGGDLGGTYPNPDVVRLQGIPVSTVDPLTGQALVYNGTSWAPASTTPATAQYLALAADASLTNERVFTPGVGLAAVDSGAGAAYTLNQNIPFTATNTTAFTPTLASAFRRTYFQQPASVVTIPTNAAVAFPIGTVMWFTQGTNVTGPGQLSVVGDVGVSLTVPAGAQAATRAHGGTVQVQKTATDSWVVVSGTGLKGDSSVFSTVSKTADYTLALTDADTNQIVNLGTAVTVTVPTFATVAMPAGTRIGFFQMGAGQVILSPAGGVTISTPTGLLPRTRAQNSTIWLVKNSNSNNNGWTVEGDLETNVAFVTIGNTAALASERALTAGTGISITDGGAGGAVTINNTGAPVGSSYVVVATDGTLTAERALTAGAGITLADTGANGTITVNQNNPSTSQNSPYTLLLTDAGRSVYVTPTAGAVTVPPNASVAFPVGTEVEINNGTVGTVVLTPGAGVTILVGPGRTLNLPGASGRVTTCRIRQHSPNVWFASGDLEDTTALVTIGADARLPNERVLTAGTGITITDGGAGGAVTVANNFGNPYKARATGSGQSIPSSTRTVLNLGATFDPNGNFASNAYTVPVTGYYNVQLYLRFSAITAGAVCLTNITSNGAIVQEQYMAMDTSGNTAAVGWNNYMTLLTAGQVIRAEAFQTGAGAGTTHTQHFTIHLLST